MVDALECPQRIDSIVSALEKAGTHTLQVVDSGNCLASGSALEQILIETHDAGYLEHLRSCHQEWVAAGVLEENENVLPECFPVFGLSKRLSPPKDIFARPGYYSFDLSTGICRDTWKAAVASANLAVEAARVSSTGHGLEKQEHSRDVLALCRPPGHHCTTKLAGGYCYLNNAVIAVHALRRFATQLPDGVSAEPAKVAILDLDFHHGNGTQSYFYNDPSVLYVSIHGEDEYPYYTGFEDEVGDMAGKGYNVNLPLAAKSSVEKYLEKLDIAITKIQEFSPQYLVVSLGFDTFHMDPLGSFDIHTEDYKNIASKIKRANGFKDIPSLFLLEGGYVLDRLGDNLLQFLKGWEDK